MQLGGLLLRVGHAAQGRAHLDGDAARVEIGGREGGVAQGQVGCRPGELRESVEPADVLALEEILRVEIVDLRGDMRAEGRRVEPVDASYGGDACVQAVPEGVDAEAQGRDGAQPGDDHTSPFFRCF